MHSSRMYRLWSKPRDRSSPQRQKYASMKETDRTECSKAKCGVGFVKSFVGGVILIYSAYIQNSLDEGCVGRVSYGVQQMLQV